MMELSSWRSNTEHRGMNAQPKLANKCPIKTQVITMGHDDCGLCFLTGELTTEKPKLRLWAVDDNWVESANRSKCALHAFVWIQHRIQKWKMVFFTCNISVREPYWQKRSECQKTGQVNLVGFRKSSETLDREPSEIQASHLLRDEKFGKVFRKLPCEHVQQTKAKESIPRQILLAVFVLNDGSLETGLQWYKVGTIQCPGMSHRAVGFSFQSYTHKPKLVNH